MEHSFIHSSNVFVL